MAYEPIKRERAVSAVSLSWATKAALEREATKRELDATKVGRSTRRAGRVEAVSAPALTVTAPKAPAFPASGSILRDTFWDPLARENAKRLPGDMFRTSAGCPMPSGNGPQPKACPCWGRMLPSGSSAFVSSIAHCSAQRTVRKPPPYARPDQAAFPLWAAPERIWRTLTWGILKNRCRWWHILYGVGRAV